MNADKWPITRLGDVCVEITVGHVGPMADKYVDDGIPFLRSQNIEPFHLALADVKFIDSEFDQKLRKSRLHPNDVVIVRTGYPGTACVVPRDLAVANCADLVIARPSKAIDSWFLAGALNSTWGRSAIAGNLVGVAQQHFNVGAAKSLQIRLPPIYDQRAIGRIIRLYSDLIENNTRRIAILEEMARRIFEEWFVHFRAPGCEGLPLVESAIGPIPQGWEVKRLEEFVQTQYGYTTSASDLAVGPQFLRGMDLNKRTYIDWATVPYCATPPDDAKRFALRQGDVLVIRMADPGKVGIVERDLDAVFASYLVRLRFDQSVLPSTFVFHLLTDRRYQQYVLGASNGTTRKSIPAPVMTSFDFAMPPLSIMEGFNRLVAPMRGLLNNLVQQNANLRAQRDLLLPKLISGEIDISAAASASLKEAAE